MRLRNKRYGVTITVMSLSHSLQESLSNLLAFKNVYEYKKVAKFFYFFITRTRLFARSPEMNSQSFQRIMVIWSVYWYSGTDKERAKTVVAISVDDFCGIASNRVRFHCFVNHGVFDIFLRWNTLNVTLLQNYNGDKALQKASTRLALIKLIQPRTRII